MNRSWVSAPICTSATWVNPAASNSRIPAAWRPASGPHGICALTSYQVNVLACVMLTAFGLGIAFPTVSITVTAGIPARQQGVAGGLFVTAQQAGAAVGLARHHRRCPHTRHPQLPGRRLPPVIPGGCRPHRHSRSDRRDPAPASHRQVTTSNPSQHRRDTSRPRRRISSARVSSARSAAPRHGPRRRANQPINASLGHRFSTGFPNNYIRAYPPAAPPWLSQPGEPRRRSAGASRAAALSTTLTTTTMISNVNRQVRVPRR